MGRQGWHCMLSHKRAHTQRGASEAWAAPLDTQKSSPGVTELLLSLSIPHIAHHTASKWPKCLSSLGPCLNSGSGVWKMLLAPGTGFMEHSFITDLVVGVGFRIKPIISVVHLISIIITSALLQIKVGDLCFIVLTLPLFWSLPN